MLDKIMVGSVVSLNSGGPSMTVESISTDDDVHCMWITNDASEISRDYFKRATLRVVEQPTSSYSFTGTAAEVPKGMPSTVTDLLQIDEKPAAVPFEAQPEPAKVVIDELLPQRVAAGDGDYPHDHEAEEERVSY